MSNQLPNRVNVFHRPIKLDPGNGAEVVEKRQIAQIIYQLAEDINLYDETQINAAIDYVVRRHSKPDQLAGYYDANFKIWYLTPHVWPCLHNLISAQAEFPGADFLLSRLNQGIDITPLNCHHHPLETQKWLCTVVDQTILLINTTIDIMATDSTTEILSEAVHKAAPNVRAAKEQLSRGEVAEVDLSILGLVASLHPQYKQEPVIAQPVTIQITMPVTLNFEQGSEG